MQLPLEYTLADLEDILMPGDYRLDAVDSDGRALDVTVPITIAGLRNAEEPNPDAEHEVTLPNTDNETRLVLEANVRATLLAFLHNQRSLEMGLRMAETLRDGVHVLADAQAECIRSLSSARGFFRNPPVVQAPTHANERSGDEEDDDAEQTDEVSAIANTVAPSLDLNAVVAQVVTQIVTRAMSGDLKLPGLGALLDWRKATPRDTPADALPPTTSLKQSESAKPGNGVSELDPLTLAHFMTIHAALEPHEVELVTAIIKELSDSDRRAFMTEFKSLDVPTAVAKIRAHLADLQRHRA